MNEDDTVAVTMRFPQVLYDRLKVASLIRECSVNALVMDTLDDKYGNNTDLEAIRRLIQQARNGGHIR